MKSCKFLVFCLVFWLASGVEVDLETEPKLAVILQDNNFDSIVQNGNLKNWFIMFHAPWCPHCKRLMPIFEQMAVNLKDIINFGVVDW